MTKQIAVWWVAVFLLVGVVAGLSIQYLLQRFSANDEIVTPWSDLTNPKKELPLLKYSIPNLAQQQFQPRDIVVTEVLADHASYVSFLFTFEPLGRKMTGQLNIPKSVLVRANRIESDVIDPSKVGTPVIVMARGYVPADMYQTGVGTKNAAAEYAKAGFITIAPDFFGYGGSAPEPNDTWLGRFEKPVVMAELIATLQQKNIVIDDALKVDFALAYDTERVPVDQDFVIKPGSLGLWGHSNGGQIVLTTLEVMKQSFPTTLWAPVTAPFPYSILFFTDELEDEGKVSRLWVAQFEEDYDVFDFSLTQHLELLQGPLLIHQGSVDDAVLQAWSDEFVDKLELENERREEEKENDASSSALPAIEFTYHVYSGADHNLRPSWDTVVARDIEFFNKEL